MEGYTKKQIFVFLIEVWDTHSARRVERKENRINRKWWSTEKQEEVGVDKS